MRTRVIAALVALLATFALAAPGTAQAAGCGSFDQWVGTYTGTYFYQPWWEEPDTEVSCAGGGVSSTKGEIWVYDGRPYGWIPIGRYELVRG